MNRRTLNLALRVLNGVLIAESAAWLFMIPWHVHRTSPVADPPIVISERGNAIFQRGQMRCERTAQGITCLKGDILQECSGDCHIECGPQGCTMIHGD